MSYIDSKMMRKKNYPREHTMSSEFFNKLKRRSRFKGLSFEDYSDFLLKEDCRNMLAKDFELDNLDNDFATKGQYLNWLIEKRLADGHLI